MSETTPPQAAPRADRVDRSVVFGEWVASAARFTLRMLVIFVFIYALAKLVGAFWAGVLPIILALIVCTVLAPIATTLRHNRVPAGFAALITLLIFVGAFATIVMLIAPDIIGQSRFLYLQALEGIQRIQLWLQGPPLNIDPDKIDGTVQEISGWIQNQAGAIAGGVFSGIGTAAGLTVTLMVIFVVTFFFLKDGHRFLPWLRSATGGRSGLHLTELLTRAWNTLSGYIRAQAIVSLIDAVLIGGGIAIVGVPMAFTLAVITFIAGFIPIVGAVVAGALAVLVALVSLGFTKALIVLAIVIAVQQIEGNILSPMLQSRAMDLHPVIILVSVTIGGGLFGLVGAFLAVPIAAMVAVAYRYMLDMLRINSGEIGADDVEFVTPEGKLIAEIDEAESVHKRQEWLGEREWSKEPVTSEPGRDVQDTRPSSTSWRKVKEAGGKLRRRATEPARAPGTTAEPAE